MKIEQIKKLYRTDVMKTAIMIWPELILTGAVDGDDFGSFDNCEAIAGRNDDGRLLGFIVWRIYESTPRDVWIVLSYVLPQHRRQGVYRAMLEALKEEMIKRGVEIIESIISSRNETMKNCKEALGFWPTRIVYRLELKANP